MKRATITELKNSLSHYLRYVKQGEPVLVLDRGVAIADITPHKRSNASTEGLLAKLEAKGVLRRGDPKALKRYSYPNTRAKPSGALSALLAERRQSR